MTITANKFALSPSIYSEALWNKTPTVKEILNVLQNISNKPKNFQPTFSAQSNEIIRRSPRRIIFTIDEFPEQFVNNLNANNDKLNAKRPESPRFSGLRRRELNIKTEYYTPLPPPLFKMKEPSVNALPPAKTKAKLLTYHVPYDLPPQPKLIEPKALLTAPPSLVEIFGGLKAEDVIDDGSLAEDEFLSRANKLLETFEKMRNLMKIAYG